MTGAFLYLTWCSTRNLFRVRIRRLRQPRYLVASIAGGLYFYLAVFRPGRSSTGESLGPLAFIDRYHASLELVASALLFAMVALAWVLPRSSRPALAFSRADVQFLFPAPITRRQLIEYKLLRSLVTTAVSTAIVTFFFRPSSMASGWSFFLGITIVFTTLNLHLTGVSLRRESLRTHGLSGLARQWLPLILVVVAGAILGSTVGGDWERLSSLQRPGDFLDELQQLTARGPAAIVLWPFRALVRLALAASPAEFLRGLPAAGLLLVLNFMWVVRSDASFEEASAEQAEKVARLHQRAMPVSYRARPAPFTLSLSGPLETALLWKNLILLGRYGPRQMLAWAVPIIILLTVLFMTGTTHCAVSESIPWICAFGAVFTALMGPHIVRNDLRQDLARLAILKTWPVRGAALVRGEILAPALVLSATLWMFVAGATAFSGAGVIDVVNYPAGQLSGAAAVMLVAPGLIAAQLVALNGLAVLFPGWFTIGPLRASGLEAFGQRLLMMFGLLLVIVVAALPATLAAGVVAVAIYAATGRVLVTLPAAVAAVVLLIECLLATEAIGRALERTSIADVDAGE
jgi:ABC-2 type transport system permease protein